MPDDKATTILRNCANAVTSGGSVLVVDTMLDGEPGQPLNTTMDLNMWTFLGGRERTRDQLIKLGAQCDLHLAGEIHVGAWRNLLEFRRS